MEISKTFMHGHMKDLRLICYGWYDGEAGFENKHDLPSGGNHDSLTPTLQLNCYMEIFLIFQ